MKMLHILLVRCKGATWTDAIRVGYVMQGEEIDKHIFSWFLEQFVKKIKTNYFENQLFFNPNWGYRIYLSFPSEFLPS